MKKWCTVLIFIVIVLAVVLYVSNQRDLVDKGISEGEAAEGTSAGEGISEGETEEAGEGVTEGAEEDVGKEYLGEGVPPAGTGGAPPPPQPVTVPVPTPLPITNATTTTNITAPTAPTPPPPNATVPGGPYPPPCSDSIWNGDESDLDCGGSCAPCLNTGIYTACWDNNDCQTLNCDMTNAQPLPTTAPDGTIYNTVSQLRVLAGQSWIIPYQGKCQ